MESQTWNIHSKSGSASYAVQMTVVNFSGLEGERFYSKGSNEPYPGVLYQGNMVPVGLWPRWLSPLRFSPRRHTGVQNGSDPAGTLLISVRLSDRHFYWLRTVLAGNSWRWFLPHWADVVFVSAGRFRDWPPRILLASCRWLGSHPTDGTRSGPSPSTTWSQFGSGSRTSQSVPSKKHCQSDCSSNLAGNSGMNAGYRSSKFFYLGTNSSRSSFSALLCNIVPPIISVKVCEAEK